MTAAEFARKRGISVQRARELARNGLVPAQRKGKSWEITDLVEPRTRRSLSEQTRTDLITFLTTQTLDHTMGMGRERLAKVVSNLYNADEPAALLREYFAGAEEPTGPAGAAIVTAAMRGVDRDANLAVKHRRSIQIKDLETLGRRVRDARLIAGESVEELAERSGITPTEVRRLERGTARLDQLRARKIAHAAGVRASRMEIREGN